MKRYLLIIVIGIFLFGLSGVIFAEESGEIILLKEGKNIINFTLEFNPLYVRDFIMNHPEISTVTYTDKEREIGYVNVFGGIGENFIIYPNEAYTITTSKEVNISIR